MWGMCVFFSTFIHILCILRLIFLLIWFTIRITMSKRKPSHLRSWNEKIILVTQKRKIGVKHERNQRQMGRD